jgi:hypothetical protein
MCESGRLSVDLRPDELYYSSPWQVLQQRLGEITTRQHVWSLVYVDAMVLADLDTGSSGSFDLRLYVQHDANFNVTALVDTSGAVVERYIYDPYGAVTVLDANWSTDADGAAMSAGSTSTRAAATTPPPASTTSATATTARRSAAGSSRTRWGMWMAPTDINTYCRVLLLSWIRKDWWWSRSDCPSATRIRRGEGKVTSTFSYKQRRNKGGCHR